MTRNGAAVSDAWLINEQTAGDWVLIGFRVRNEVRIGTLSDAALAQIFLTAGDGATEDQIAELLLRAVRGFLRRNPNVSRPAIDCPLDLS
jgi:hypothetical protein